MKTYLLTWNPRYSDNDWLNLSINRIQIDGSVTGRWSCGNNQGIKVGGRVFLLKQGVESPGIVGAGWIVKASYQGRHWDASKAKRGLSALYVRVEWKTLLSEPDKLSRANLLKGILPSRLVNIASSGVAVSPELAEKLEAIWTTQNEGSRPRLAPTTSSVSALEGGIVEFIGYRRKRDIKLRESAFKAAQGVCAACGFDFSQLLDGLGSRVLQVHHRKQLSEGDLPRLTRLSDLAVVCANCHCLIHANPKKAMKVEQLKSRFTASKF